MISDRARDWILILFAFSALLGIVDIIRRWEKRTDE